MTTDERSICDLPEDLRQKAMFNESQRRYNTLEWQAVAFEQKRIADEVEACLPKVQAVIEAGKAMRDNSNHTGARKDCICCKAQDAWDRALADLLGQKK
jgi:hypothetical protein